MSASCYKKARKTKNLLPPEEYLPIALLHYLVPADFLQYSLLYFLHLNSHCHHYKIHPDYTDLFPEIPARLHLYFLL